MTQKQAIARELRSVARYLRRCSKVCEASLHSAIYEQARGFFAAADICNRRASKLTAKAKKKGQRE